MIDEKDINVGLLVVFPECEKITLLAEDVLHQFDIGGFIFKFYSNNQSNQVFEIIGCDKDHRIGLRRLDADIKTEPFFEVIYVTRKLLCEEASIAPGIETYYKEHFCRKKDVGGIFGEKQFETTTFNMLATYKAKNHDYGNSFTNLFNECGMIYAYGHMAEKLARVKSLMKDEEKVKGESMKDSLLDLANYAILTVMELDNHNENNSNEPGKDY